MTGPGHDRPVALRRYGQHHLVDAGTLAAILEMAAVEPDDVVLEVGAADGLLTVPLLERATVVHAFEVDRRFEPALTQLAGIHPGLRVVFADVLRTDLETLRPPPTAMVSNLAYNIAIPLIVRSLTELPSLQRWAVMVQRELADRLFASPSTKAYSAVSVLVQLQCTRRAERPVPRTVFSPRPRVDSAFVVFERRPGAPDGHSFEVLGLLVRHAFGQRRKMLATSLSGVARGGRTLAREEVRAALASLGRPSSARPEELSPDEWVPFAEEIGWV